MVRITSWDTDELGKRNMNNTLLLTLNQQCDDWMTPETHNLKEGKEILSGFLTMGLKMDILKWGLYKTFGKQEVLDHTHNLTDNFERWERMFDPYFISFHTEGKWWKRGWGRGRKYWVLFWPDFQISNPVGEWYLVLREAYRDNWFLLALYCDIMVLSVMAYSPDISYKKKMFYDLC